MKLALLITGAPCASQAAESAWHAAQAALATGHELIRVFLHGDGVYLASSLAISRDPERDWFRQWSSLIREHDLPATACVGSALRRGLLDERESRRHGRHCANLASGWVLGGLGDWVEAECCADRVLHFQPSW